MPETLSRFGYKVTGGDIAPENFDFASQLSFKLEKIDCDGQPLPFEDNRFDVVILTEVFEHLHIDPLFTLQEILRILRPGGFIYLTTPNVIAIRALVRLAMRRTFADIYGTWERVRGGGFAGHIREYTPREIDTVLQKVGFTGVKTTSANVYWKNPVETLFWRGISAPFPRMRETIVSTGVKP